MDSINRVLVTGATGFVGKHLVYQLDKLGFEVFPLVRSASADKLKHPNTVLVDDLFNIDAGQLPQIDAVVHLIAKTHDFNEPVYQEYYQLNVELTNRIAQLASDRGAKKFIYLSSIKANGESTWDKAFSEADTPKPEDYYGKTKLEAELLLEEKSEALNLKTISLRVPLLYGPGVKANFKSLIKLTEKVPFIPLGAINNKRSVLGLDNLSDCVTELLRFEHLRTYQTFCLADQPSISTSELIQLIIDNNPKAKAKLFNFPAEIIGSLLKVLGKGAQWQKLNGNLEVSSDLINKTLKWKQPFSTSQQFNSYLNHAKQGDAL